MCVRSHCKGTHAVSFSLRHLSNQSCLIFWLVFACNKNMEIFEQHGLFDEVFSVTKPNIDQRRLIVYDYVTTLNQNGLYNILDHIGCPPLDITRLSDSATTTGEMEVQPPNGRTSSAFIVLFGDKASLERAYYHIESQFAKFLSVQYAFRNKPTSTLESLLGSREQENLANGASPVRDESSIDQSRDQAVDVNDRSDDARGDGVENFEQVSLEMSQIGGKLFSFLPKERFEQLNSRPEKERMLLQECDICHWKGSLPVKHSHCFV